MGYCALEDVAELNTGRTFSATSRPTASQVVDYIEQTAAVIDAVLRGQGYNLPVPTTATSVLKLLEGYNALGAACMVEQGAPTARRNGGSRGGDLDVCAMWRAAQKMLADGTLDLELPLEANEHLPRTGPSATPFFSRSMDL
jgi:hypothetical protein